MSIVIATIAKNEDSIIAEWVAYHILIGASIIHILDDQSVVPIVETLQPLIALFPDRIIVDRIKQTSSLENNKLYFYNRLLLRHQGAEWLSLLDVDEFIWPGRFEDVRELLNYYKDKSYVEFNPLMYNHNYHTTQPEGLLISNYTLRSCSFEGYVKYFTRPRDIQSLGLHGVAMKQEESSKRVSVLGEHGINGWAYAGDETMIRVPHIKHYFTQDIRTMVRRKFNIEGDVAHRDYTRDFYSYYLESGRLDPYYSSFKTPAVFSSDISDRYALRLAYLLGKEIMSLVDNSGKERFISKERYQRENNTTSFDSLKEALLDYADSSEERLLLFV